MSKNSSSFTKHIEKAKEDFSKYAVRKNADDLRKFETRKFDVSDEEDFKPYRMKPPNQYSANFEVGEELEVLTIYANSFLECIELAAAANPGKDVRIVSMRRSKHG